MPFHVRCTSCKNMIAKGVRFNAIKRKCGRYLGTIIYQFNMTCHLCKNEIIIKTNPKQSEYDLIKGVLKYIPSDIKETNVHDEQTVQFDTLNAFSQIEKNVNDVDVFTNNIKPSLERLLEYKEHLAMNFYDLNKQMRNDLKNKNNGGGNVELGKAPCFKHKNGTFKQRDSIIHSSIFKKSENEERNKLLKKKHMLDINLQLLLNKQSHEGW